MGVLLTSDSKTHKKELKAFEKEVWRDVRSCLRSWPIPSAQENQLDEVLNREWMHRAWTFQELILAYRPLVLCGGKTISWDDLVNAIEIMAVAEWDDPRPDSSRSRKATF